MWKPSTDSGSTIAFSSSKASLAMSRLRMLVSSLIFKLQKTMTKMMRAMTQMTSATQMPMIAPRAATCGSAVCMQSHNQFNPLMGASKSAEQRTIRPTQQYRDCYTGCWWMGCYIGTAHQSSASITTSYYTMWHYNYLCTVCTLKG